MAEVVDAIIARELGDLEVDCSAGCHWCCHQLVLINTIAEGRAILEAAKERMSREEFRQFRKKVRLQARKINSMPYEKAEQKHWTCPLLKDGQCVVYDVRPVACRSVFSPDRRCCEMLWSKDADDNVPADAYQLGVAITNKAISIQHQVNASRQVDCSTELRVLLTQLLDANLQTS
jgi:Fe-S-cluster containining protein